MPKNEQDIRILYESDEPLFWELYSEYLDTEMKDEENGDEATTN